MAIILIIVAFFVVILLIMGVASQTTLSTALLPKDVSDAARKTAGDTPLTDAQANFGTFTVQFQGSQGLNQASVYRHDAITVSIAQRENYPFPAQGSFVLLTEDDEIPAAAGDERVTLSDLHDSVSRALNAAGFTPASAGQQPALNVRCLRAGDESITDEDIDHLHAFIADKSKAGASAAQQPVYVKGSLVIDISDGANDVLLWRAAAVATTQSTDDIEQRKARIDAAIKAMFEHFPTNSRAST